MHTDDRQSVVRGPANRKEVRRAEVASSDTRLRAEDAEDWLSGDITIDAGVGLLVSQDGTTKNIQLDATTAEPPAQLYHYRHGTLADGEFRRWKNTRVSGKALLALIEAHLETAPGASVDSANYPYIRIAGTTSGSADLPLNVAGQNYFTFDAAAASQVAGQTQDDYGYANTEIVGWGLGFTMTADTDVQAVSIRNDDRDRALEGNICKVMILDMTAGGTIVAEKAFDGWFAVSERYTVTFEREVRLSQSREYLIAFYIVDWFSTGDDGSLADRGWAGQRDAAGTNPVYVGNATDYYRVELYAGDSWTSPTARVTSGLPAWWCIGRTAGVLLEGYEVVATVGTVGAPAAADYGAMANVRAEIDPGERYVTE